MKIINEDTLREQVIQVGRKVNRFVPVMKSLHYAMIPVLKGLGFYNEHRRIGELKVGLWRKHFNEKKKSKNIKRFVLMPGFGDTPMSWIGVVILLLPYLKKNYDEVVLVDFPGYLGFLYKEKAFHSMDLLHESLHDVLDSLTPHTVLGHSLGGWIAASYAASCGEEKRPKNISRKNYSGPKFLFLANPSGVLVDDQKKAYWSKTFDDARKKGFDVYQTKVFAKIPLWFYFISPAFEHFMSQKEILEFMHSFDERHLVNDRVSNIKSKVWLLWGENDTIVPEGWAKDWLEAINKGRSRNRARALVIKKAGHSIQLERTAMTSLAISTVLSQPSYRLKGNSLMSRVWKVVES